MPNGLGLIVDSNAVLVIDSKLQLCVVRPEPFSASAHSDGRIRSAKPPIDVVAAAGLQIALGGDPAGCRKRAPIV